MKAPTPIAPPVARNIAEIASKLRRSLEDLNPTISRHKRGNSPNQRRSIEAKSRPASIQSAMKIYADPTAMQKTITPLGSYGA